jgi:hypothetical protein
MSSASTSRPERSDGGEDDEVVRRRALAVDIVAEGLLTLLLRERLAELDARDAAARLAEEAHAQTTERRVPVAGCSPSSAVSTTRAKSPGTR